MASPPGMPRLSLPAHARRRSRDSQAVVVPSVRSGGGRMLLDVLRFAFKCSSNRALEPAKAGSADQRFECRFAPFLGEAEPRFGEALLGCLIADQERDRCA